MFYVYILYSARRNRYYVGSTQNTENRLIEHNLGETLSTRAGIPWVLVYTRAYPTRGEAVQQENKIKARGIKRYLVDLDKEQVR